MQTNESCKGWEKCYCRHIGGDLNTEHVQISNHGKSSGSKMVRISSHFCLNFEPFWFGFRAMAWLEIQTQPCSDFRWIRISSIQFSDPHCIGYYYFLIWLFSPLVLDGRLVMVTYCHLMYPGLNPALGLMFQLLFGINSWRGACNNWGKISWQTDRQTDRVTKYWHHILGCVVFLNKIG